jgi:Fe-S-cluster containining protein
MNEEMIPMQPDDILPFECSPANECFNDCCRNLNQFLTPYDILRLKHHLKLLSSDFLKQYTSLHHGPSSGLPVIEFKPNPGTGYACPFVTDDGCAVYENRPGSCRMYPLARAISRSRETGQVTEYFALIEEPHCKGFNETGTRTVARWLQGQDVKAYNEANDKLMEIIRLKNTIMPGRLDGYLSDQFYLALYDLDTFRKEIFENNRLKEVTVPPGVMEAIRSDDNKLLDFGMMWVAYMLFGQKMDFSTWA